ncbi:MAG: hypothetical protein CMA27_05430 [Euryarchaeota archaeon]|nr:hypothetical protein [Euryarchaeota archaeon]|tara:strand:- start:4193 stop:5530 length:1338 start_codon:yes stop_codon:yes gene_type:complete
MKYSLKINKERGTLISSFFIFSSLFIFYDVPWGLMDDYRWIESTKEFLNDPRTYIDDQKYRIREIGMIQPFLFLQYLFQYLPGITFGKMFTFIPNILLILVIHYYSYIIFKEKLRINYLSSLLIFLIYPYTTDMFFLPSLQEKFSFLIFLILLQKINKNTTLNKKYFLTLFLLSLAIPLVKLQGSIFFIFFLFYFLLKRSIEGYFVLSGFILGILLQGYVIFFQNSHYYNVNSTAENILDNILQVQNIFFLFFIFLSLLLTITEKDKETKYLIFGICGSGLALIFLYINWETYGYLMSFYAFFIALLIPYNIEQIIRVLNFKVFLNLVTPVLLIFSLLSLYLFFIPRIERWSDLNDVYTSLDNVLLDEEIFYCGSEGALTFNNLNNTKNEVTHISNFSELKTKDFFFINDDMQCSYFEEALIDNCTINQEIKSTYKRVEIIKYSC